MQQTGKSLERLAEAISHLDGRIRARYQAISDENTRLDQANAHLRAELSQTRRQNADAEHSNSKALGAVERALSMIDEFNEELLKNG